MDSATQPVLCCIGESVAGKPTQFMMERAFAASGLDWRALTVEVDSADLPVALAGMKAMRLPAMRFFGTGQAHALQEFSPEDEILRFIGRITSVSRIENGWAAWHNQGYGILQRVAACGSAAHTMVWLHGDSEANRSLAAALHGSTFAAAHWSDPPDELPSQLSAASQFQLHAGNTTFGEYAASEIVGRLQNASLELETVVVAPASIAPDAEGDLADAIHMLADHVPNLYAVAATGSKFDFRTLVAGLRESRLKIITHDAQHVASEQYDFERWTGVPVDFALMRDAFDEYFEF